MDAAEAKAHYTEAKRLFRAGHASEALSLLRALDDVSRGAAPVRLAQAECLVALGDPAAARGICEAILAEADDPRARRILARCADTPPPLPIGAPALPDFDLPEDTPQKTDPRVWWAIGAVVVGTAAVALIGSIDHSAKKAPAPMPRPRPTTIAQRPSPQAEQAPADPVAAYEQKLNALKAKRDLAKEKAEAELAAEKEKPGYVIPPEEWNLDPVTGVPEWRPGIYKQVPIPGTFFEPWQGPRTLDLYIPRAYAEQPDTFFPTVSITMPSWNAGFLGLEKWAEERDVILIVVNSSSNDSGFSKNTEGQIDAVNFLYGHLRTHPTLNFAVGTSGGARMALLAASRWPDAFAGVLMMAHAGDTVPLSPALRIGIIYGRDDFNAPWIPQRATYLKGLVQEVRVKVIPGGHITAPPAEQARMLDWMLDAAREDLAAAAGENTAEVTNDPGN
jgi:predicted esterase